MIGRTNSSSGGGKSCILPPNPTLIVEESSEKLKLSWTITEPTEIEIARYNIYISEIQPISLKYMRKIGSTSDTNYTVTGLTNGELYYVAVESVGVNGYENASMWKIKKGQPFIHQFLAIGYTTTSADLYPRQYPKAYYSDDGIRFQEGIINNITYGMFKKVISVNNKYIAVGNLNQTTNPDSTPKPGIIYSEDGINWQQVLFSESNVDFNNIRYINGRYYAVGNSRVTNNTYLPKIYYSNDGINWIYIPIDTSLNIKLTDITYGEGKYIAVGKSYSRPYYSFISDDGINWESFSMSGFSVANYVTIKYINEKYVVVNDEGSTSDYNLGYSINGVNWIRVPLSISSSNFFISARDIDYINGEYIITGLQSYKLTSSTYSFIPSIKISNDFINWETIEIGPSSSSSSGKLFNSIAYRKVGKYLVGGETNRPYYSINGRDWIAGSFDTSSNITNIIVC